MCKSVREKGCRNAREPERERKERRVKRSRESYKGEGGEGGARATHTSSYTISAKGKHVREEHEGEHKENA
jgi:hypothetical protein